MGAQRHWDNLVAAVYAYGQQVGGFGSVTVRIGFHEGLPVQLDVLNREERCRLDGGGIVLTPKPGPVTLPTDNQ